MHIGLRLIDLNNYLDIVYMIKISWSKYFDIVYMLKISWSKYFDIVCVCLRLVSLNIYFYDIFFN